MPGRALAVLGSQPTCTDDEDTLSTLFKSIGARNTRHTRTHSLPHACSSFVITVSTISLSLLILQCSLYQILMLSISDLRMGGVELCRIFRYLWLALRPMPSNISLSICILYILSSAVYTHYIFIYLSVLFHEKIKTLMK